MMHSITNIALAMTQARDMIVDEIHEPVPGEDLIEILSDAILNDGFHVDDSHMSLEEVKNLVVTVARQRNEAYELLKAHSRES